MAFHDLRLLAAMHRDPFGSLAAWGRVVGVSAEAVRKRLKRLEADGVLQGWMAVPAPEVFGRRGVVRTFPAAPDDTDEAALLASEAVVVVARGAEGLLMVMGYPRDDAESARLVARLEAELGPGGPFRGLLRPPSHPPRPLGRLEWRVLDALLDAPRATLEELAERTGIGAAAVRARRDEMAASGVLLMAPCLGPSTQSDLFYHLGLRGALPSDAELRKAFPECILLDRVVPEPGASASEGVASLFCHSPSLLAREELLRRAAATPGVADAVTALIVRFEVNLPRLHGWIAGALASSPGSREQATGPGALR